MVSKSRPEDRQNWGDNVFEGLLVGPEETGLVCAYLANHDLAPNSRRAIRNDLRKLAGWFSYANREPFAVSPTISITSRRNWPRARVSWIMSRLPWRSTNPSLNCTISSNP